MAEPSEKAQYLASLFIDGYGGAAQLEHRLQLISSWTIKPGARVLEIGCGQGECTVALADAVGATGHVDAIDPGSPDYGESEARPLSSYPTPSFTSSLNPSPSNLRS